MMKKTDAYFLLTGRNELIWNYFHFPPISISSWVVKTYLNDLMRECTNLSLTSIDVVRSLVIAKLCNDDVRFFFYCRYKNGKVKRIALGDGEFLDKDLCPPEFLDLFNEQDEVIIARG